jgi:TRAP-type uncharacterized transport system substrate-binding protein
MSDRRRSLRAFIRNSRLRLTILFVSGVLLIALGLSAWCYVPKTQSYQVKISGGKVSLNRQKVAEYLKRHGSQWQLDFEIVPTQGTAEAVGLIQSGELDLALVNGLLRFPNADSVRQVATVTFEVMHLLVKRERSGEVSSDYGSLANMSVDLGPEGSETSLLAEAVLNFLRLPANRTVDSDAAEVSRSSINDLMLQLDQIEQAEPATAVGARAALPDVLFFSSTLPSTFVERLVCVGRYDLVPIRFTRAFSQIPVDEEDLDRDHIDQIHAETAVIPAYTYGGAQPIPAVDCPTFGLPLIIIAHKDVPNEVVSRLLRAIFSGALARLYRPPPLTQIAPTFPLHAASVAYRDKDKPLVRSDIAELLRQVITGLGPLLGGCLALYGFYRWRQLLRFLEYFRELQQFDLAAKGLVEMEGLPIDRIQRLRYLEGGLVRLQSQVVEDFCRNYFYGEGVLENFLSLMTETRDFLRRSQVESLPTIPDANFKRSVTDDSSEDAEAESSR